MISLREAVSALVILGKCIFPEAGDSVDSLLEQGISHFQSFSLLNSLRSEKPKLELLYIHQPLCT